MDDRIVEFRNGDADCVYYAKDGHYELTITKCGEMSTYKDNDFAGIERILREGFYFDDKMIEEMKRKIYIWNY